MAVVTQPDYLPSAFAANGDYNTIPATNDGTAGLASYSLGFPQITEQPLAQGGLPPQRGDFNGILRAMSLFLTFYQNGGVFTYSATQDYQPPAVIWGNGNLYKCKAQNGPNTTAGVHGVDDDDYWELVSTPISVTENGGEITITQGDSSGTSFYAAINLLQRNKAYSVGDYAYSPKIPSWSYLECTSAGTTGASEPANLDSLDINDTLSDGTATFKLYHIALQSKPVGSIYESSQSTNPGDMWGGTWETYGAGRVLVGAGQGSGLSNYTAGSTGGEEKHQLTTNELPEHTHSGSINTTSLTGRWMSYDWDGNCSGIVYRYENPTDRSSADGDGKRARFAINATHSHSVTLSNSGGNQSHENRPPYIVIYRFRRID